ncbi:hydroxymethylglutaryl-CoA reductase [Zooshikella sp. RANM57]|uniref:hydroxymethylglutaryl-CoA reductase n=1 Tax=Zooshikella sp. RANM57 TaxID=3425863 RepID=UPI003D6E2721
MKTVGPIKIKSPEIEGDISVPLATFETPLWPSTARGAKISRLTDGIYTVILSDCMTRSILLEAPSAQYATEVVNTMETHRNKLTEIVAKNSNYAHLENWHCQVLGNLLYIRVAITTGDASGHNMITQAADAVTTMLLQQYKKLKYISISGNYCTDKKVSAVNGILGRGKYVVAEILVPKQICEIHLKTTPTKLVDLHIKKNLLGTLLAGGVRTANAHFANILLAIYLATGQDAANIVEGSQGIVHAEIRGEDLYFSVTLPNIIVGTIGNGKQLDFAKENLNLLGCDKDLTPGKNARRLAVIVTAAVLCGEISLLAALCNPGELMRSHLDMER